MYWVSKVRDYGPSQTGSPSSSRSPSAKILSTVYTACGASGSVDVMEMLSSLSSASSPTNKPGESLALMLELLTRVVVVRGKQWRFECVQYALSQDIGSA